MVMTAPCHFCDGRGCLGCPPVTVNTYTPPVFRRLRETIEKGIAEGERRREQGLDRVQTPVVSAAWLTFAKGAAERVAAAMMEFTTDDVWAALEKVGIVEQPSDNRAMGAVMRWLRTQRMAVATDHTRLTTRPSANRRPITVWCSLTYEGPLP